MKNWKTAIGINGFAMVFKFGNYWTPWFFNGFGLANHWYQWFFNGFSIRDDVFSMVSNGS